MPDLLIRPDINVRSMRYFIASTSGTCWHCQASTRLIALGLPPGHQTLDFDDDERPPPPGAAPNRSAQRTAADTANGTGEGTVGPPPGPVELKGEHPEPKGEHPTTNISQSMWSVAAHNAFLFYVDFLPEIICSRLQQLAQWYRFGQSRATESSHWANHCERCDSLLDDHELFCEPEGAFLPANEASAALIHLLPIDESIEAAAAGYAYEPAFFDAMSRGDAMIPGSPAMTQSR